MLQPAILELAALGVAAMLAQYAPKPLIPEQSSERLLIDLANQLQARDSTPDLPTHGLPHWEGVTDVTINPGE